MDTSSELYAKIASLEKSLAEERQKNRLFQNAIETLDGGFVLYDNDDRLVFCNETYRRLYKLSQDQIVPGNTFEAIVRTGAWRGEYVDAIGREEEWVTERVALHHSGNHTFEQELTEGRWLKNADRRTKDGAIVGLRVDITQTKHDQLALKQHNEYLATLNEMSLGLINRTQVDDLLATIVGRAANLVGTEHGFIHLWDSKARLLEFKIGTGNFKKAVGFKPPSGKGQAWKSLTQKRAVVINDYSRWSERIGEHLFSGLKACITLPLRGGQGVIGLGFFEPDERQFGDYEIDVLQRFAEMASIAFDSARLYEKATRELEKRRQTEKVLRQSESRLRGILDSVGAGIFTVNPQTRELTYANPAAAEILEIPRSQLIGRKCSDLVCDLGDGQCPILDLKRPVDSTERELQGAGDRRVPVLKTASKAFFGTEEVLIESFIDLTRLKQTEAEKSKLEEQLTQSRKLESLGRLAGGIAHDLNNLLTPIMGYSEMLLQDTNPHDARVKSISEIDHAAQRAQDIVRQLLAFSRKQTFETKTIDINEIVTGFEKLLRRTIREDIDIVYRLFPDPTAVETDVGQIEQVIMNLAVNAQDAMPCGGKLTIETAEVDKHHPGLDHKVLKPANSYIRLGFQDTGHGIPAEIIHDVFDPFFTTKAKGKGTGLGLATVFGIIDQHGGTIAVESQPDRGTRFDILLPASVKHSSQPAAEDTRDPLMRGNETIVVVEDDDLVRQLAERILKRGGYRVSSFADPLACLKHLQQDQVDVDLILTDVVMPGLNGRELVEKLRSAHPEMQAIFMSGYTNDIIDAHGIRKQGCHYLQKPFTLPRLTTKVREVLDRRGETRRRTP